MLKRVSVMFVLVGMILTGMWYVLFALKPAPMSEGAILERYALQRQSPPELALREVAERQFDFQS